MHESAEEQRARLAYEASLRALDQQRRSLEEIRARTGVLLAAAALSASFLGARALDRHVEALVTALALAALMLTLLAGIRVLALHEQLAFSLSGSTLHASLLFCRDRADQHRQLADWLDAISARNKPSLERIETRLQITATALATQIVLWTVAITTSVV
jgi:hypothetical protein